MRFTLYGIVLCVAALAGCQTPALTVQPDAFRYTVSVAKLTISTRGRELLGDAPQAHLPQVLKRRDTDVKQYPPVYLQPGETQEVNRQKRVDFPAPFTSDGELQGMEHDAVGELVRATLEIVPKVGPQVRVEVDDARLSGWQTIAFDKGEQRIPQIERASIESTLQPGLGEWAIVGSTAGPNADRVCVFLARVDPPGRAPTESVSETEEDFTAEDNRGEDSGK